MFISNYHEASWNVQSKLCWFRTRSTFLFYVDYSYKKIRYKKLVDSYTYTKILVRLIWNIKYWKLNSWENTNNFLFVKQSTVIFDSYFNLPETKTNLLFCIINMCKTRYKPFGRTNFLYAFWSIHLFTNHFYLFIILNKFRRYTMYAVCNYILSTVFYKFIFYTIYCIMITRNAICWKIYQ